MGYAQSSDGKLRKVVDQLYSCTYSRFLMEVDVKLTKMQLYIEYAKIYQ